MEAIHHRHGEFFHWNSSLEHFIQTVHICTPTPPDPALVNCMPSFCNIDAYLDGRVAKIYIKSKSCRDYMWFFWKFFFVFQVFGSFFGFAKEIWGFFLFLQVCLSNLRFFENFLQLFMLCIQMSAAESVQMNDEILHWIRIGWYVDCQR